jgi:hypothetical protein
MKQPLLTLLLTFLICSLFSEHAVAKHPSDLTTKTNTDGDSIKINRRLSNVVVFFTIDSVTCNGGNNGAVRTEVAGTNPPFTYSWSTGATTPNITNLVAGSYTVVVKNSVGDSAVATAVVEQPDPIFLMLGADSVTCNGGNDGGAFAEVGGGTDPLSYLWSNGATGFSISNVTAGKYFFRVTDAKGCTKNDSVIVTQPLPITITQIITPLSCFSACAASINITATDGIAPYTYLWNTGAQTPAISSLCAGTYSVTVTDTKGCTSNRSVTVSNPSPPTVSLGADRSICSGQAVTLDGTLTGTGNSYQWTSTNGFTSALPVVNVNQVGSYFLSVTTVGGCVARDTIVISASNTIISSDFAIATQVFRNRTITVVNIAEPKPDSILWIVPNNSNISVLTRTPALLELVIRDTGLYTIGMRASRGVCQSTTSKTIKVLEPQTFDTTARVQDPLIRNFSASPNPTSGQFTVRVNLRETGNVRLRLINAISNTTVNDRFVTGSKDYTINYNMSIPSGVYVLLLETAKASRVLKLIIN